MPETGNLGMFVALKCQHWEVTFDRKVTEQEKFYCEQCKSQQMIRYVGHIHISEKEAV